MKLFPRLVWFLFFPAFFLKPARGQAPAEKSAMDRFAEMVKQADEELANKFAAARAVVEDEIKKKRLGAAIGQSLHWSLRSASSGALGDVRMVLSNARVPVGNEAVKKTFEELEALSASVQERKSGMIVEIKKEVSQRIAKAISGATKVGEVEAVRAEAERLRDMIQKALPNNYLEIQGLDYSVRILAATKRLIEAEDAGNISQRNTALSELSSYAHAGTGVPLEPIYARIESLAEPLEKVVETRRAALNAAFAAEKPAEEIDAAISAYLEAGKKLSNIPTRDNRSRWNHEDIARACRALAGALTHVRSRDKEKLDRSLSEARTSAGQIEGEPGISFRALLDKWAQEAKERAEKAAAEQMTSLRTRLATVRKPEDLALILKTAGTGTEKLVGMRPDDAAFYREITTRLSVLASAWISGSPALLTQNRGDDHLDEKNPIVKEYRELRKRVEREVMSRALQAPELMEGEMLTLPWEQAVDKLCAALAAGGDWRRLYRVLDGRSRLMPSVEFPQPSNEAVTAVRAYLTGQNLEMAEQWREACESYREVLRCVSDYAPIKPAAERLKILAKEHPEAVSIPKGTGQ